ncbi:acyl carrier protein [Chroogloeocystis siderophila]|jgi:acyl carrier protein|uniref:Polyketide synthase n=1 Tax=Chroogloeocystis siderophila 5.2 s.c.1 TaxID=247279 RepID=A0A1U7HZ95_9CHRO|nr:acyl carrier protein [Chroogloeocystis siderophila]OKH28883.1 polyketide synthase [Chroogloeocystis siderophila 5.2 s.c.1]
MNQSQPNLIKNTYTAAEIHNWLIVQISEQLGIESDEINIREPLDSYGLDSAQAMLIARKAEKLLGCQISPVLIWHYPTIEGLSQRLAEESEDLEFFEI